MLKTLTELVFILDRSGSMAGLESDTIGGYNSMLKKQRGIDGKCRITTVLFNHDYKLLHDGMDIRDVGPMTHGDYRIGGTTALLDAIGETINKIVNLAGNPNKADQVIFVIITDGEENSSREFSLEKIKAMVERQQSRYGWEFIFLGANIDAIETAGQFGIDSTRAADYLADSQGTELNFRVMAETVANYRQTGQLDESYLDEIRQDAKERGKKG